MLIHRPLSSYLLLIALCTSTFLSAQESAWKLSKSKDGIKVYTRTSKESVVKEFKAMTTVKLSLDQVTELFENVSDYHKWMANVSTCKLIQSINENETLVYYTSELPWPINDRDMVVRIEKYESEDGSLCFYMSCEDDVLEEYDDYLRIKLANGVWEFTPNTDSSIEITYQFLGDPGGNLPAWVLNLFIVDGPFETLENIREMQN